MAGSEGSPSGYADSRHSYGHKHLVDMNTGLWWHGRRHSASPTSHTHMLQERKFKNREKGSELDQNWIRTVRVMVFSVVLYGRESCIIKRQDRKNIDAFDAQC